MTTGCHFWVWCVLLSQYHTIPFTKFEVECHAFSMEQRQFIWLILTHCFSVSLLNYDKALATARPNPTDGKISREIKPPNHPPHHESIAYTVDWASLCMYIYIILYSNNKNIYVYNSPHLCVGLLFLVVHFRLSTPPLPPAASHSHISLTHNLSQHNLLTQHNVSPHNLLTHNLSPHNLSPHNLSTHNLLPHNLSTHNLSTHNLLTHNFAWHAWHLWRWTGSGGALGYFGRRGCLRGRHGAWRHRPSLCVAGMALGDIDLHFASLAWHLVTSTFILRGRCGTYGTGLALAARLGALVTAVCVAGVALADIDLHFAWQAWHLVTSTYIDLHFAWQAWHLATWTCVLRGRRGTYGTTLSHKPFTHNFVTHNSFTHNFVTHNSFTHNSFTHNFVTFISFTHTIFTHNFVTYNSFTHTTLLHTQTYTHTHNIVTHSSFTQPVLHHLLSFLPFPSHFHICLWSLEEVDLWGYPVL